MLNFFDLRRSLDGRSESDPDDVLNVKQGLAELGFYRSPARGLDGRPEEALFDGVRAFQGRHGLTVDGMMRPGGETVRKLNDELTSRQRSGLLGQPTEPEGEKPWWRSGRVGETSATARFQNAQSVHHLLGQGNNGDLPNLYAAALRDGGHEAIAETADFLGQLHGRDPERAAGFGREVWNRLSPGDRNRILMAAGSEKSEPVPKPIPPTKPVPPEMEYPVPPEGSHARDPLPQGLTERQVKEMMNKHGYSREEAIEKYREQLDLWRQQEHQRRRIILGK